MEQIRGKIIDLSNFMADLYNYYYHYFLISRFIRH